MLGVLGSGCSGGKSLKVPGSDYDPQNQNEPVWFISFSDYEKP